MISEYTLARSEYVLKSRLWQNWSVWLFNGNIIVWNMSFSIIDRNELFQTVIHFPEVAIIVKSVIFFLKSNPSFQTCLIPYDSSSMSLELQMAMDIFGIPVSKATWVSVGKEAYLLMKTMRIQIIRPVKLNIKIILQEVVKCLHKSKRCWFWLFSL